MIDVEWLDVDALPALIRHAEAGLPVVLCREPGHPGRSRHDEHRRLLDRLRSLPAVVATIAEAGVAPLVDGVDVPPFWARRTAEALYLFFAHPAARGLRYPMRYGQSLEAGAATRRVTIDHDGERFPVALDFEPNGSLLLRVTRPEGARSVDLGYRPPPPIAAPGV